MALLCGSTLWLYSVALLCGSTLWLYSVALLCGSTLWLYSVALLCGSTLWLYSVGCLKQEPGSPLCLIDPKYQEARGRNVTVFVAKAVNLAHACCQLLIVVKQFGHHIE